MPASDDDSELYEATATADVPLAGGRPAPAAPLPPGVPPEAVVHLCRLGEALAHYRAQPRPALLEGGFAAAGALVATLYPGTGTGRPELEDMRRLAAAVPEFDELLSAAAGEAEPIVSAGTAVLWSSLGLGSPPPRWTPAERAAARMVFACACAPAPERSPARLHGGLRALAAGRFAELLCGELSRSEEAWSRALADRYESVRHRCARRTTWRSLGLSELVRADEQSRNAVTRRLERWLANGGRLPALADELEAALVHARTPARFA